MPTQRPWRQGGAGDRLSILAPARAFGELERRLSRRRRHRARGKMVPDHGTAAARPTGLPSYWRGDERDTTQGDW